MSRARVQREIREREAREINGEIERDRERVAESREQRAES